MWSEYKAQTVSLASTKLFHLGSDVYYPLGACVYLELSGPHINTSLRSNHMRAVIINNNNLTVEERPDRRPGKGELLIRVRAAGLNAADLLQLRGMYPAPSGSPLDIPGLELAGEVVEIGPDVFRFSLGNRVMAIVGDGAQAELVVVNERQAALIPETLSFEEAGGVPEAFITADDALFTQCSLSCGERLLVNGGAGGVGTAAIQLGIASGATVTTTVRNPLAEVREAYERFANGGKFGKIVLTI